MASARQIMACGMWQVAGSRWYSRASSCSTQDCGSVWCRIVALEPRLWHEGRACGDVAHADCPFGQHSLKQKESGKAAGAARDPSTSAALITATCQNILCVGHSTGLRTRSWRGSPSVWCLVHTPTRSSKDEQGMCGSHSDLRWLHFILVQLFNNASDEKRPCYISHMVQKVAALTA